MRDAVFFVALPAAPSEWPQSCDFCLGYRKRAAVKVTKRLLKRVSPGQILRPKMGIQGDTKIAPCLSFATRGLPSYCESTRVGRGLARFGSGRHLVVDFGHLLRLCRQDTEVARKRLALPDHRRLLLGNARRVSAMHRQHRFVHMRLGEIILRLGLVVATIC